MALIERVLNSFGFGEEIHYECRNCGTTLEEDIDICPECGATEIAEYRFPIQSE